MKFIATILLGYLLFLSVLPCCSFDNCSDEEIEHTSQTAPVNEDCNSCSPFFNCGGCATATVVYNCDYSLVQIATPHNIFQQFESDLYSRTHSDFWQPPRQG